MTLKILLQLSLPFQAFSIGDEKLWPEDELKNFCLDPEAAKTNDELAIKHPTTSALSNWSRYAPACAI